MFKEYLSSGNAATLHFTQATCVSPGAKVLASPQRTRPPYASGHNWPPVCSPISCQSWQQNVAGRDPIFRNVTSAVMKVPSYTNLVTSAVRPATFVSCRKTVFSYDCFCEGAGCPAGCFPWDAVGRIDGGLIGEFGPWGWTLRMAGPISIMPSNTAKATALPANQRSLLPFTRRSFNLCGGRTTFFRSLTSSPTSNAQRTSLNSQACRRHRGRSSSGKLV